MDDASATAAASLLLQEAGGLPRTIPVAEIFPSSLPRQWRDFRRSGMPRKMGGIKEDTMTLSRPLPPHACVIEAFAARTPIAELVLPRGRSFIIDFLRKMCVRVGENGAAVSTCPLYWVGAYGQFFMSARLGGVDEASVRRAFHGPSQGRLAIKEVRRCRHREALVLGFLDKMRYRDAWLFGWYGASAADVEKAADGGDVTANWQLIGADLAHGRGVHVSTLDCLEASASLSLMSTRSQPAQVLFCALAPGSREVVPAGSSQLQSSNLFFHTGTNSISKTKWYVFWENLARTSLLPLYTVTFSTDSMSESNSRGTIGFVSVQRSQTNIRHEQRRLHISADSHRNGHYNIVCN